MTRLLAVCAVPHPGGAETGLLRLLRRLGPEWSTTLATPAPGPLDDAGFPVERLDPGPLGGGSHAATMRAMANWPRARRLARPRDVVYLNGTVTARLLPAIPRSVRTVLHVHDMVERVPRHWRRADVVLADSAAVAARLHGLPAHVVGCPVELDPAPAEPPWPPAVDGAPVIGFVGRIEPRKGPLDLVEAAPEIRAAHPGARIVLVGDDPYRSDPQYAARVRAATDVEQYGWAPDAPGLMRHLDVLVAPSREEPFGTVLAEAMAVGTPVVATDVDGLPDTVRHGETGLLVPPGDPRALAGAIVAVLADRERMSANARAHARCFDADAYAARVKDLIAP